MKHLILVCLLTCISLSVWAYPINPRPLRKLIMESEFIIVGEVQKIDTASAYDNKHSIFSHFSVATILVNQVVQGNIQQKTIKVRFYPYMTCPAPARYREGTTVLAFLDEEGDYFGTHALSYGSKTLEEQDLKIYLQRIIEMQKIQQIPDTIQQRQQTVDWLVRCTEHQATRWEGIYELSPESDFMSYYDYDPSESFKYSLKPEQKAKLKKIILQDDKITYEDLGMVDLVMLGNEDEMLDLLKAQFKKLDPKDHWMAEGFMERLVRYSENEKLLKLMEEFAGLGYFKENDERRIEIVAAFQKEL